MTSTLMRPFEQGGAAWNSLISQMPTAHLLQTWEWAQLKAAYGWQPLPFVWQSGAGTHAAAMVLSKQVTGRGMAARLHLLYVPKGPLLDWNDVGWRRQVLTDLEAFARKEGAIFLKIDPDIVVGTGVADETTARQEPEGEAVVSEFKQRGWIFSSEQIQFRNTVMIDLTRSEGALLANMKPKTRYNVRLAEKKGVTVRRGSPSDISLLYRMYAETSARDGFVIRSEAYYTTVWRTFMLQSPAPNQPAAQALIAEVDREPVAALFLYAFAGRAYYLYGMSRELHREKMPNHLLQWQAIRSAKEQGCVSYDLWGAPDAFTEADPMWGVFRFKEGLGGEVVRTAGAWDFASSRLWYPVYTRFVPFLLGMMRARGRERTRRDLAAV
jgi:lipid II:glycine glycyltransferase (peptidoglycan interpeptide bridge formation enzyme)